MSTDVIRELQRMAHAIHRANPDRFDGAVELIEFRIAVLKECHDRQKREGRTSKWGPKRKLNHTFGGVHLTVVAVNALINNGINNAEAFAAADLSQVERWRGVGEVTAKQLRDSQAWLRLHPPRTMPEYDRSA